MKSLARDAGLGQIGNEKRSAQDIVAKYWGTMHNTRTFYENGVYKHEPRKFTRSDGSVGADKTRGFHARPAAKQAIRNANRAITKRARQVLKQAIKVELQEANEADEPND